MAGLRMAYQALARPVANLFKGASKGDLALRFGPDIGYSLMAGGLFAPPDATLAERAAMMGEDLAYGVGSSILGQGLGRQVGVARAKGRANAAKKAGGGRYASPEEARAVSQQNIATINNYQTGGDVLGQMGMVALPRPVTQGVYEAAGERANRTAEQVNETQREMLEEQQLMVLLGQLAEAGYLAGSTVGSTTKAPVSSRVLNA